MSLVRHEPISIPKAYNRIMQLELRTLVYVRPDENRNMEDLLGLGSSTSGLFSMINTAENFDHILTSLVDMANNPNAETDYYNFTCRKTQYDLGGDLRLRTARPVCSIRVITSRALMVVIDYCYQRFLDTGQFRWPHIQGSHLKIVAPPEAAILATNVGKRDVSSMKPLKVSSTPERPGVSPISSFLIKPAIPTQPHYIPVSNLDVQMQPVYTTPILLYRGGSGKYGDQSDRLAGLKSSLSKVLVEFYPMAGRLVKLDDSSRPCVHCNDCGVLWTEFSSHSELAVLEDYYPPEELLGIPVNEAGPSPFYPAEIVEGVPILTIQVTLFKCGGMSLSLAWQQCVADGKSGWSFLLSWAEVCREESRSILTNQLRLPLVPSAPPAEFAVHKHGPPPFKPRGEEAESVDLGNKSGMVLHKILLSKARVEALKKEASSAAGPADGRTSSRTKFSSAVSVSAHLWRILTRSRDLPDDRLTHFSLTVDGQSCLNMSPNYFGNSLRSASAMCTAGDLLASPLSFAASLIHEGTNRSRSNQGYDWLTGAVGIYGPQSGDQRGFGQDVAVTFWTQLHVCGLDFGWGAPVFGGRNIIPRKALDGFLTVKPFGERGSLLVLAYLNDEVADRFLRLNTDSSCKGTPVIKG